MQEHKQREILPGTLFDTQCLQTLRGMEKAAGRGGQNSDHKASQGCVLRAWVAHIVQRALGT